MIVVIDGTGPDDDRKYATEMGNSFCSQLKQNVPGSTYFRGPTLTGSETSATADLAVDACLASKAAGNPIRLAGYSRGGCAAIIAAKRLGARGHRVSSMFLFDPVDMQFSFAGLTQIIGDNVDYVARVRSGRHLGFWLSNPVKSRFYFVNTGRYLAGSGAIDRREFEGSHGAIGGVPWPDIPGDRACAMSVANWMTPFLNRQGIPITLRT